MKPSWKVNSRADRVFHTKKCQHYRKGDAEEFKEIPQEDVPDSVRVCKACAGTANKNRGARDSLAYKLAQDDIGPEDYGMEPVGER